MGGEDLRFSPPVVSRKKMIVQFATIRLAYSRGFIKTIIVRTKLKNINDFQYALSCLWPKDFFSHRSYDRTLASPQNLPHSCIFAIKIHQGWDNVASIPKS